MSQTFQHTTPKTGLAGLRQNWRNDLIAAVSVALVAMPLALGIAVASGMPPMSGIFSAIIGGIVTTFVRGSHIAINGPANGSIAVIIGATALLDDGSGRTLHYVLAAIVVSGAIQVILGFFKLGRYAEMVPSSVIQGILAAIGVIIVAKQIHVALGTTSTSTQTIEIIKDALLQVPNLHPIIALISILGLVLLIFHARISYKFFHFLPAPMWVLVIAISITYLFGFSNAHNINVLGKDFLVGPQFLINLPEDPLKAILFPDFSRIQGVSFWLAVLSINIITSIETLVSTKAIDKLDPYRRKTNQNKDLMAVGFSTMISGALGGLPIITVIVRSTVNVHNNARTKWSNLYHGLLLLIFIVLLVPVIQRVPLAALAAILVFSGFKLTAPRIYKHAYDQGMEQLLFLAGTLIITLYAGLLWGLVGGILITLGVHILLARVPIQTFFHMIYQNGMELTEKSKNEFELKIDGIANFLSILKLKNALIAVPDACNLKIDLSSARLIDLTVLESLDEFKTTHEDHGGSVDIKGLSHHVASTHHRLALKSLSSPAPRRLTKREVKLQTLAHANNWRFRHEVEWDVSYLRNFRFFETRPIEQKNHVINGSFGQQKIDWEISDITFDEGALLATEVYHTTVQVVHLPGHIPRFTLEHEGLFDKVFDRVMAFTGQKDIDFELFTTFSNRFLLKGENESAIRNFFNPAIIEFLEEEDIYHIESNGEAMLIFNYLRPAKSKEILRIVEFSQELIRRMYPEFIV